MRSAGASCGASFASADAAGDAVASRPGTRRRGFVALGVEATFDESRGITYVIPVRFEHQTVDAQTTVLQNPVGIEGNLIRDFGLKVHIKQVRSNKDASEVRLR